MTYSEHELEFTFAKNHCFLRLSNASQKCNQHYVIIRNISCSKYAYRYFPPQMILTRTDRPINALRYGWCFHCFVAYPYGWHRSHANGWFTLKRNLHLSERPPPTIFARMDRPVNALQLCR